MYYSMENGDYNLAHVVRVQHLKGIKKYGYKYYEAAPDRKVFFGMFKKRGLPAGWYLRTWDDQLLPSTEEQAHYKANQVDVWFIGDENPREWTFETEEEALEFIEKCKQASPVCKFK